VRAREIVAHIDWPCDVRRNYADKTLVFAGMYTGMTGFSQFEQHFVGRRLLPIHLFPYCTELLENIAMMGASHDQRRNMLLAALEHDSYYFTVMPTSGLATWRDLAHYNAACRMIADGGRLR